MANKHGAWKTSVIIHCWMWCCN